MKHLGIDYGAKHIGLATSDAGGVVAMPESVIPNDAGTFVYIQNIIEQQHIEQIVIGHSVNLDGSDNTIQSEIESFTRALELKTKLSIKSISELFSSRQAKWGVEHTIRFNPRNIDKRRLHKKQRRIDDKAAAILLQSYLDSQTAGSVL